MRVLHVKLLRDLRHIWPQLLAIAAVIGAGVAVCISMLSALASLEHSRDSYYASSGFADVFVSVKRAPESISDRLREIPGVDVAESRIVADVTIDVPGFDEPAVGRLISIPDEGASRLNRLLMRRGSYPAPGGSDRVVASEAFVNAHHLRDGDSFTAVLNGRWKQLTIVGVALSPEYVYSLRSGDLFPDDKRFGVFWMRRRDLAAAFDLDGAFNDIVFRLSRDARVAEVIERIDVALARYGGLGAYARKDQTSAWFVDNELAQLTNMGFVTPFIFAGVAAFLLHVVISRLVSTQREQIGVLKAFGYTNAAVARHYVAFVLAIAAVGVGIGVAAGAWSGAAWTRMYTSFFRFPGLTFVMPTRVVVAAAAASAVLSTMASLGAVRRAVAVPPADAMRPAAPASYHRGILERLHMQRFVPVALRMVIRNLERRAFRALLSVVAIALAVGIVIVGIFVADAIYYIADVHFNTIQRQDVTVTFKDNRSRRALYELRHLSGVARAEPVRVVPVRLRHANLSRRLALVGLANDATLARVVDTQLRPVALPREGLLVNDALASALDVRPGDAVIVEVLEGGRPVRTTVVADIITEYLGLSAYMDIDAANRLMQEGSVISGGYLQIDSADARALYRELKMTPDVANVSIRGAARQSFQDTVAEMTNTLNAMFALFGAAIAFGVIYNNNRIAFAERARELGTLHVLGFSHAEMAEILLGEMAVLTLLGLPLGLLAGRVLGALVVVLFSTELYRIPLVIAPATNGIAVAIAIASAAVSAVAMWRQLVRLDVVSVLKAPE